MSSSAQKLAAAPPAVEAIKRGPSNVCGPVYGVGDLEDWEAIEAFRHRPGESWRTAQMQWDDIVQVPVDKRITNDKFRYHWRRKCFCWPADLRLS